MTNSEKFTDQEWEKIASILSDEESENHELINRFMKSDLHDTAALWKNLKDMSNNKNIDVEKAWQSVSSKIGKAEIETTKKAELNLRVILTRIAAVILVLISIGTGSFYLYNKGIFSKQLTFSTGNDEKNLLVELSDGSRIFLNRNSELTYLKDFGKKNRNVKLSGEAFFEIAADAAKPFTIDAGSATVKVVGTSFNVITSNNDSQVEVFVKSGKVLLSDSGSSGSIELDPGYIGKIDAGKPEKKINTDLNYLAWNTGLLVYNGQTLDLVFKDLKRVYNMNIIADDNSILENRWTSPIDNQSQETIIRLICVSFNLSYTQDANVYHLVKR